MVDIHQGKAALARLPHWQALYAESGETSPSRDPRWLTVLSQGLKQQPFALEVEEHGEVQGWLPLLFVRSSLFGRFLVSLPYLNSGGVMAKEEAVAQLLVERAAVLAKELGVRYLELRHEMALEHADLEGSMTSKVHMRLELPQTEEVLWKQFKPKVRNQIRKGESYEHRIAWGRDDLFDDFYNVFSRNMRDLGTPVYGRRLFANMLQAFGDAVEFCVVYAKEGPIAAALLVHGPGTTEVPSASSLRAYNSTNANMLMYWQLLKRAIERGQKTFDFGRSTVDSNTFRFKKQWGARPQPAVWQYHVLKGSINQMRPDNGKYNHFIRMWQKLPVRLTQMIGPPIVRGIP